MRDRRVLREGAGLWKACLQGVCSKKGESQEEGGEPWLSEDESWKPTLWLLKFATFDLYFQSGKVSNLQV
jgi:hypothetical protein